MQQKYLLIHSCLPCGFCLNWCCCLDLFLPHRIMNPGFISVLCPDLYSRQSVWKSKEKKILTWIFSSEVKTKTLAKTQTLLFCWEECLVCVFGWCYHSRKEWGKEPARGPDTCAVLSSQPYFTALTFISSLLKWKTIICSVVLTDDKTNLNL